LIWKKETNLTDARIFLKGMSEAKCVGEIKSIKVSKDFAINLGVVAIK